MAIYQYPRRRDERPHTRIQVDTSAVTGSSSGSNKVVMLVGSAQGGAPNTVYHVRNMHQATNIFRGGELLDALQMAWNPSVDSPGAGDILAMRVEDAKPASLEQEGINFVSKLYGREANNIEIALETVGPEGDQTRNFVVQFAPDNYKETLRNVDTVINVQKEEDGPAYASVEVTGDNLIVHTGDGVDSVTEKIFVLGQGGAETVNSLVNELNNVGGIQATVPLGSNRNVNTIGLDAMEETEIPDDGPVRVTALIANLINQLEYNPYIDIELPESVYTDAGHVKSGTLGDFELTPLTGGDDGNVPLSWADKFREFANEGGFYLVPLTADPTVHAEATAFVKERTDNGEPMRAIVGAGYDEPLDRLLGRAAAIRHPRTMLVGYSGDYAYPDGRIAKTPAYMFAAQVAGLASGLEIGEAVTFEHVNINSLATVFTPEEISTLNSGGVVTAEFVRNGQQEVFRVVDDVTTYNDPSDPVNNQMGVGEASDFLVSELKIHLDEAFIGSKVVYISSSLIKNEVESFLDQKKRDREIQDYNPEDVQVVIHGEVANISLVVYPIRSLKEIAVSLVYNTQTLEA